MWINYIIQLFPIVKQDSQVTHGSQAAGLWRSADLCTPHTSTLRSGSYLPLPLRCTFPATFHPLFQHIRYIHSYTLNVRTRVNWHKRCCICTSDCGGYYRCYHAHSRHKARAILPMYNNQAGPSGIHTPPYTHLQQAYPPAPQGSPDGAFQTTHIHYSPGSDPYHLALSGSSTHASCRSNHYNRGGQ